MIRTKIIACLVVGCALIVLIYAFYLPEKNEILITKDPFDPLITVLTANTDIPIKERNPYQLGHLISGVDGAAFLFGSQSRVYSNNNTLIRYHPLFSASVVIAVNTRSSFADTIVGWNSLLESGASVLIPDQGTEMGRLAAIALSKGLGAETGNLRPALDAYRMLAAQNRLNPKNEYSSTEYRHVYQPHRPDLFDAVIMFDYQARYLARSSDNWLIVEPVEGSFLIDCGYIISQRAENQDEFRLLQAYLESDEGKQALLDAGFGPLVESTSLSGWDKARLLFNPMFRRIVRLDKLHAPASVRERLLLQSVTLLLFYSAAFLVIRRVPRGINRNTSITALAFVLLWMVLGILKTVSVNHNIMRQFWFLTYLPRHTLPLIWYCMCHLHIYKKLPNRKLLISTGIISILLTMMILTNDYHQQAFRYHSPDYRTWEHFYSNGWVFFISVAWSFAFTIIGLVILFKEKMTRRQKRQYLYALAFLVFLIVYQFSYMIGLQVVIDLDVPTSIGMIVMVFMLVNQRERFMGALLLSLPILQKTTHGIAVLNDKGEIIFHNETLQRVINLNDDIAGIVKKDLYKSDGRVYVPHSYYLEGGQAIIFEDITDLKALEEELILSHKKIEAIHNLLIDQAEDKPRQIAHVHQEQFICRLDQLLQKKIKKICLSLSDLPKQRTDEVWLRQIRLIITQSQQRLRLVLAGYKTDSSLPSEQIITYIQQVFSNGKRIGLDGVVTAENRLDISCDTLPGILDIFDEICLLTLKMPAASLICHLSSREEGHMLSIFIEQELHSLDKSQLARLVVQLKSFNSQSVKIHHAHLPDGLSIKAHFAKEEAAS